MSPDLFPNYTIVIKPSPFHLANCDETGHIVVAIESVVVTLLRLTFDLFRMNEFLLLLTLLGGSSSLAQQSENPYSPDYVGQVDLNFYGQPTPEPFYPDGVNTIPGHPDVNYPTLHTIPRTSFNCENRPPGFYADLETGCQVWHTCDHDSRLQSFLCANGTIYSQENRVCDWWYNTQCVIEDVGLEIQQNRELYMTGSEGGNGVGSPAPLLVASNPRQEQRPHEKEPGQPRFLERQPQQDPEPQFQPPRHNNGHRRPLPQNVFPTTPTPPTTVGPTPTQHKRPVPQNQLKDQGIFNFASTQTSQPQSAATTHAIHVLPPPTTPSIPRPTQPRPRSPELLSSSTSYHHSSDLLKKAITSNLIPTPESGVKITNLGQLNAPSPTPGTTIEKWKCLFSGHPTDSKQLVPILCSPTKTSSEYNPISLFAKGPGPTIEYSGNIGRAVSSQFNPEVGAGLGFNTVTSTSPPTLPPTFISPPTSPPTFSSPTFTTPIPPNNPPLSPSSREQMREAYQKILDSERSRKEELRRAEEARRELELQRLAIIQRELELKRLAQQQLEQQRRKEFEEQAEIQRQKEVQAKVEAQRLALIAKEAEAQRLAHEEAEARQKEAEAQREAELREERQAERAAQERALALQQQAVEEERLRLLRLKEQEARLLTARTRQEEAAREAELERQRRVQAELQLRSELELKEREQEIQRQRKASAKQELAELERQRRIQEELELREIEYQKAQQEQELQRREAEAAKHLEAQKLEFQQQALEMKQREELEQQRKEEKQEKLATTVQPIVDSRPNRRRRPIQQQFPGINEPALPAGRVKSRTRRPQARPELVVQGPSILVPQNQGSTVPPIQNRPEPKKFVSKFRHSTPRNPEIVQFVQAPPEDSDGRNEQMQTPAVNRPKKVNSEEKPVQTGPKGRRIVIGPDGKPVRRKPRIVVKQKLRNGPGLRTSQGPTASPEIVQVS